MASKGLVFKTIPTRTCCRMDGRAKDAISAVIAKKIDTGVAIIMKL